MTTQHIPGPWGVVSPNPTIGFQIVGHHVIVAAVPKLFDEPWAEANARLIAAAPDLLEALKRIENWRDHSAEFSIDFGSNGVRDLYRGIAKAAITKATGETP